MLTPAGRALVGVVAAAVLVGVAWAVVAYVPAVRALFAARPSTSGPGDASRTVDTTASVEPTAAIVPTLPPSPTYAVPVRLRIAKLKVDARIEQVGQDKDGVMVSPRGPSLAGWYKFGTKPGERGSAVIAGHSGYRDDRAAIFDNLKKLVAGDEVVVVDKAGAQIRFVVREGRLFDPAADTQEVFGRYDGRFLNLVTCTGAYSQSSGTHSKRLVVFTVAVDEPAAP